MGDLSTEMMAEEILNSPLNQLDMEKIQKSPWMKYLLIRNESEYRAI